MASWLCFRAKPEEDNIYLNLQRCINLAESVGGKEHGFKFIQVPMNVMMPEAFVEKWQEFFDSTVLSAGEAEQQRKILVAVCNTLKMNVFVTKPLLEGRVLEVDMPKTVGSASDPVAKHLQLVRSLPPRCIISTMCGMKTLPNVKTNF